MGELNALTTTWRISYCAFIYRLDTVNSKSIVGSVLLRLKARSHPIFSFTPNFFFFFFLKFLADTCPFWGPLVPLFWISGNVSSGFQSQSGFCLIHYFCGGKCNVHSPRFTSVATLADLLAAGAQPVTSPHACAEVGLGSDSNVQPHEQKTNALPLCQRPGFGSFIPN